MENLLQIGSVFQIENVKFLIIGYSFQDSGENLTVGYKCLGLPYGYIKKDSVKFVAVNDVAEIVFKVECEEAKDFIKYQSKFFDCLQELGIENAVEVLKAFENGVKEESQIEG